MMIGMEIHNTADDDTPGTGFGPQIDKLSRPARQMDGALGHPGQADGRRLHRRHPGQLELIEALRALGRFESHRMIALLMFGWCAAWGCGAMLLSVSLQPAVHIVRQLHLQSRQSHIQRPEGINHHCQLFRSVDAD